jgi:RNA ligase
MNQEQRAAQQILALNLPISMSAPQLLTRAAFRKAVSERDNSLCVICSEPAADAHHILERRLWADGGYYLDNGASLCRKHHMLAETTDLSVEDIRRAAGISKPIIPSHLYDDQIYDKWGNPILANGQRLQGELFHDPSVQKILTQGEKLTVFTNWVKYPRTYHLPWSQSITKDDRVIESLDIFLNQEVVVTKKMDGENSTLYPNHCHARSLDSQNHPSRNWLKNFWQNIRMDIPRGWRICGENLFATHSIPYTDLPSYFLGFSIWDERNNCFSWEQTLEWFQLLKIEPVPTIYTGVFDEAAIKQLWNPKDTSSSEGYVVRLRHSFHYSQFRRKVAKFVRPNQVQTTKHWMAGARIHKNGLAKPSFETDNG